MPRGASEAVLDGAATPAAETAPTQADLRRWAVAGAVLVALLVWVFWDFFERQIRFAINQQADWGHTLVIPVIVGYLVYLKRDELKAMRFRTNWLGLLPLMIGIGWYVLCAVGARTLRNHNLMSVGVALAIVGLVVLLLGMRATRTLLFPMIYLFVFGQTISTRLMNIVTFPMQDITALGSHLVLDVFLDIDRLGNTLYIFDGATAKPLNIAEACSGMRMLMAFLALGVLMAYMGLPRWWQRVLLVALAVPTAIVVNVLRVITLALLSLLDTEFAAGDFHTFVGLVWLVPAFAMFLGLRVLIRNLVLETPSGTARHGTGGA